MDSFVLKGNLCWSREDQRLYTQAQGYVVCEKGLCRGVFDRLPEQFRALPLLDFGDRLILPGMVDLHIHAPQFSFRGMGMDLELLQWLERYTFPEEAKYRDLSYAALAYEQFVNALRRSSTTRLCAFATVHGPATELLMDLLEDSGLVSFVGKVNMDSNCPDFLRESSAQASLEATESWLWRTKEKYSNTKPILTPRFIPSCSQELLRGLGLLALRYGVPVQSHLSENLREVDWVGQLCPQARFYGDAYHRFGLFGSVSKCIMAHCVHSGEEEVELMKKNGVFVAHSPLSNTNLASGVAPMSRYLAQGLRCGLASDVAGGDTENMMQVMVGAIRASNLRWRLSDQSVDKLSVDQAFYLATLGGGAFFGKVGSFLEGYEFDAVILDDSQIPHPQSLDVRARLERCIYRSDERHVTAKFVRGRRLF